MKRIIWFPKDFICSLGWPQHFLGTAVYPRTQGNPPVKCWDYRHTLTQLTWSKSISRILLCDPILLKFFRFKFLNYKEQRFHRGPGVMAQQGDVLVTKPNDLRSIPRDHIVFWPPFVRRDTCAPHTYTLPLFIFFETGFLLCVALAVLEFAL